MTAAFALRGDDERLFAPGGRVSAAKLFPLKSSQGVGLRVLDGRGPEHGSPEHGSPDHTFDEERRRQLIDDLYKELDELIQQPDALDKGSESARRMAEIDAQLSNLYEPEVAAIRRSFEERRLLPRGAGAACAELVANVLAELDHSEPDDAASDDG